MNLLEAPYAWTMDSRLNALYDPKVNSYFFDLTHNHTVRNRNTATRMIWYRDSARFATGISQRILGRVKVSNISSTKSTETFSILVRYRTSNTGTEYTQFSKSFSANEEFDIDVTLPSNALQISLEIRPSGGSSTHFKDTTRVLTGLVSVTPPGYDVPNDYSFPNDVTNPLVQSSEWLKYFRFSELYPDSLANSPRTFIQPRVQTQSDALNWNASEGCYEFILDGRNELNTGQPAMGVFLPSASAEIKGQRHLKGRIVVPARSTASSLMFLNIQSSIDLATLAAIQVPYSGLDQEFDIPLPDDRTYISVMLAANSTEGYSIPDSTAAAEFQKQPLVAKLYVDVPVPDNNTVPLNRVLSDLDLRGNELINARLDLVEGEKPGSFGINEEGVASLVNPEGELTALRTSSGFNVSIGDGANSKLDKSGGVLVGKAYIDSAREITSAEQLSHKGYVDGRLVDAAESLKMTAGSIVSIVGNIASVDVASLHANNRVEEQVTAGPEGVIALEVMHVDLEAIGTVAERMTWQAFNAEGESVSVRVSVGAVSTIVTASGFDPNESVQILGFL